MKLAVLVLALAAAAYASETVWWTPPEGPVCVSDWWPYTCAMHGGDEENVCVGYERYADMESCAGTFTGPEGPVCVSSWWPYQCDMHAGDEENVCVGYDRYATLEACGVSTAGSTGDIDGYCVSSWWDPYRCDLVSADNCTGWYPLGGGYETEEECLGQVEADSGECTFNCGDYCVTQWWPLQCGAAASEGGCAGWTRYDSIAECCPESNPNCDQDFVPNPADLGYCVESWTPETSCVLITSGNCLANSWYPDTYGWETQCECEGTCKKEGELEFKHPVNMHKQIDALKTIEVLKLHANWAAESAIRAAQKAH